MVALPLPGAGQLLTVWIVPNNHPLSSPFARDMEGLSSDLKALSAQFATSAWWRSKPSPAPTWLQRLKPGGSVIHPLLSGRILPLSRQEPFETLLTYWLRATHARITVTQESGPGCPDSAAACGSWCEEQLIALDRDIVFSKTLTATSPPVSEKSLPTWLSQDTEWKGVIKRQRSDSSRRLKQALLTAARECSSLQSAMTSTRTMTGGSSTPGKVEWPTPTTRDHKDGDAHSCQNVPVNGLLGRAVHHYGGPLGQGSTSSGGNLLAPSSIPSWATPRCDGHDAGRHRGKADSLHSQVKMWPTPRNNVAPSPDMKHLSIDAAVLLWPTPVANDDNKTPEAHLAMKRRMSRVDGSERTQITSLQVMVKSMDQWPTPSACSGKSSSGAPRGEFYQKMFPTQYSKDGEKLQPGSNGQLNPRWAETLMHLPVGWVRPTCSHPLIVESMSCA